MLWVCLVRYLQTNMLWRDLLSPGGGGEVSHVLVDLGADDALSGLSTGLAVTLVTNTARAAVKSVLVYIVI